MMIELKSPLLFSGRMFPVGAKIGFMPKAQERDLVEAGNAIYIRPPEIAPSAPPVRVVLGGEQVKPPAVEIEVVTSPAAEAEAVTLPANGDEPPLESGGTSQKLGREGRGCR